MSGRHRTTRATITVTQIPVLLRIFNQIIRNRLMEAGIFPRRLIRRNVLTQRHLRPLYTGWRPLCLPRATITCARSPLRAQRRQNGCLGQSKVEHTRFRHRHGCQGHRKCFNLFKTVAQRSPRELVVHK